LEFLSSIEVEIVIITIIFNQTLGSFSAKANRVLMETQAWLHLDRFSRKQPPMIFL